MLLTDKYADKIYGMITCYDRIGVTLNTYTHLGLEDVEDELKRMKELDTARKELDKTRGEKPISQKMFRAI